MYFQSAKAIRMLINIRNPEFTVQDYLQNLLKLDLPSLFVERFCLCRNIGSMSEFIL